MTAKWRVLVADAISAEGLAPIRQDPRFEIIERTGLVGEELAEALRDVDAVLVRSATKITRASLGTSGRLKVIGRAGVGVDTIDVDAATQRGIAVLTAPSGNTISAAELTFALLLALVRRVAAADRSMRAGEWKRSAFNGTELYGKTLGLVGAGRIGGEVARRARAFGMRTIAYDPYLTSERAQSIEVEPATLEEVLDAADVITLHVPLTDSTSGLLGAEQLARLKPTAVLVNASRGGIVDEAALISALREGRLAGAALDVFDAEPLPKDHPFRSLDNVVLTPHLGASTAEAQQNVAVEIADAVRAALADGDLSRAVNAPAIAGDEMRRLRPLFSLGERLGALVAALSDGPVETAVVRYAGSAEQVPRPLAASVMMGVLSAQLGKNAVNLVNAFPLTAARGIELRQVRIGDRGGYAEYIEVELMASGRSRSVAGALLAAAHPRIVSIGRFHVDIVPRGTLLVLHNRDVPGVIGRIGSILGDNGVNIGEYHQARLSTGGDALAAVSVDGVVTPEILFMLQNVPEVTDLRQVSLDRGDD